MKKVVIVTYIPFWMQNAGFCARLYTMVDYLSRFTEISVIFAGSELDKDLSKLDRLPFRIKVIYLDREKFVTISDCASEFRRIINSEHFDVCIIEYLDLSFLLEYIPARTKVILDTHDIMFERHKSFDTFNVGDQSREYSLVNYSKEEELALFNRYDAIVLISPADQYHVRGSIENSKVIVAPHPPALSKRTIRKHATNISFVASSYYPNVDAMVFFIEDVWPLVTKRTDLRLCIYGNVCRLLNGVLKNDKQIKLFGFVDSLDSIYANTDVVINPVRMGAGIKIKNMEALANGLPLVTSVHGARGLETDPSCFLIADTTADWIKKICDLVDSYDLRVQFGDRGFELISRNYTPQKCFSSILDFIQNDLTPPRSTRGANS